jgi:hypothetical protein
MQRKPASATWSGNTLELETEELLGVGPFNNVVDNDIYEIDPEAKTVTGRHRYARTDLRRGT